jgi:hypothetical protein
LYQNKHKGKFHQIPSYRESNNFYQPREYEYNQNQINQGIKGNQGIVGKKIGSSRN